MTFRKASESGASLQLPFRYPSDKNVRDLIEDYRRDFGIILPFEDAERMLTLYNEQVNFVPASLRIS